MSIQIPIDYDKIADFCQKWKITEFALFGSVLRDDFQQDRSDVDVLVSFDQDAHWTLFDLVDVEDSLSIIFARKVDLIEKQSIEKSRNYLRKKEILQSYRVILCYLVNETIYLDMLNSAKLAQDFVAGVSWDDFQVDLMRQAAVTRQFEIIGEAARRISETSQAKIPDIPWHQIIGMRNRIAHEYDRLTLDRLWQTVQIALPELVVILEETIKTLES